MASGTETFRLEKSNSKLGLGLLAAALVLGLLALLNVPPHFACWLSFGGLCLIFSLMALIPCMVMRVRIDYRGIEYRSIKKTYIRWQDAEQIFIILDRQSAVIYCSGKRIAVGTVFGGFSRMLKLIEQYAQVEIGNDATLEQKEIGDATGKTFRKSKLMALFGVIFLALAVTAMFGAKSTDNPIILLVSTVGLAAFSICSIQSYFFDKLFINKEKLVRYSLRNGKVTIRWDDIVYASFRFRRKSQRMTLVSRNDDEIIIPSEFRGFDDILKMINTFCPVKPENEEIDG